MIETIIVYAYDALAILAACLLAYVGTQASKDMHLNRTDRPWVRKYRFMSFIADAAFQFLSVCFQQYWLLHPTVVSVGAVVILQILFGGAILVASLVSMRERAPPSTGHRIHATSFGRTSSIVARLASHLSRHGR